MGIERQAGFNLPANLLSDMSSNAPSEALCILPSKIPSLTGLFLVMGVTAE